MHSHFGISRGRRGGATAASCWLTGLTAGGTACVRAGAGEWGDQERRDQNYSDQDRGDQDREQRSAVATGLSPSVNRLSPSAKTCHDLPGSDTLPGLRVRDLARRLKPIVASRLVEDDDLSSVVAFDQGSGKSGRPRPQVDWGLKRGTGHCHRLPFPDSREDHRWNFGAVWARALELRVGEDRGDNKAIHLFNLRSIIQSAGPGRHDHGAKVSTQLRSSVRLRIGTCSFGPSVPTVLGHSPSNSQSQNRDPSEHVPKTRPAAEIRNRRMRFGDRRAGLSGLRTR